VSSKNFISITLVRVVTVRWVGIWDLAGLRV